MIEKFIQELENILASKNIDSKDIVNTYRDIFQEYVRLGQSEFDIIMHFGEPSDIVAEYEKTGVFNLPNMDERLAFHVPSYLKPVEEEKASENITSNEVEEANNLPTTKAGLICNDIFFVGIGMLIVVAGIIALGGVSIFMTAGSIAQMGAVWELATKGEQIGGFFMALLFLVMSIVFYVIIVWIAKIAIKFMKKYVKDHRECWAKIIANENNN